MPQRYNVKSIIDDNQKRCRFKEDYELRKYFFELPLNNYVEEIGLQQKRIDARRESSTQDRMTTTMISQEQPCYWRDVGEVAQNPKWFYWYNHINFKMVRRRFE